MERGSFSLYADVTPRWKILNGPIHYEASFLLGLIVVILFLLNKTWLPTSHCGMWLTPRLNCCFIVSFAAWILLVILV